MIARRVDVVVLVISFEGKSACVQSKTLDAGQECQLGQTNGGERERKRNASAETRRVESERQREVLA